MSTTFQEVVETFAGLKQKFQAGEISRQQFIDEMKKLRLKDEQGRYWMIGAQSGKWYYFDGRDWIQAEPPSLDEKKTICVYCGFENKLESESCARCGGNIIESAEPSDRCPKCGSPLEKPLLNCPQCAPQAAELKDVEFVQLGAAADAEGELFTLRSVRIVSAFFVLGIFGIFAGALFGAFAGATGSLAKGLSFLPGVIRDQQGKLFGALIDGLLGAAAGFAFLGLLGAVVAYLGNFALSVSGGLKIRLARSTAGEAEPAPEKSSKDATGFGFNLND